MSVLRTQLAGVARRPARLLLTGLAVLLAAFVVYATVLAHRITERTVLDGLSGTPAAADLVVGDYSGTVDAALLARVRSVPGVAEAVGRVASGFGLEGTGRTTLVLHADPGSGPLATVHTVRGTYPRAAGEIAVTERTVQRLGLDVGGRVTLAVPQEDGPESRSVPLTVSAVVAAPGDSGEDAYGLDATVAGLTGGHLQRIEVRLAAGATPAVVRAELERLGAAAGAQGPPPVRPGADVRLAEAQDATEGVDAVFAVVAAFILIAVVAAVLVASSTFRIVFAQRLRQLALLRAVGADRRRLSWALIAEGALTGLVSGVVGVAAAAALGLAVAPAAGWWGLAVAAPGIPLVPAAAVVVGAVLVTVVAVSAPAFSATRVSPLEALRTASTAGSRRTIGPVRTGLGIMLALAAGGVAALVVAALPGPDPVNYDPLEPLLLVIVSGALTFAALMTLGPALVRPVLHAVGWPLRRSGPLGRLAVGGVGGAPRRAAAVSMVVALGATLVTGTLVGAASVRTVADAEVAVMAPADLELVPGAPDGGLPTATVERARQRAELAHVTPYRRAEVTAGAQASRVRVVSLDVRALPALSGLAPAAGSLGALGPGRAVLSASVAGHLGVGVGQSLPITREGRRSAVTVVAVLTGDVPLNGSMLVDGADLDALGVAAAPSGLLADAAAPGEQARTAAREALRQVTGPDAPGEITVLADQRDEINDFLDALVAIAVGLIGLTVLIAVVGVGTTTALSVVERTRESGLLRAVGLSRGGLRTMLTTESALYGLIGASIGVALGVPYGWLAVRTLDIGAPLDLPYGQLVAVFVVLAGLTAVAGVLPARRAAKVSPVAALAADG